MHNNYFFILQLVKELKETLTGFSLAESFSQNKNEAVFSFVKPNSEYHIVAHLTGQFSCLAFPKEYSKARKNTAAIFKALIGQEVVSIESYENERAFNIVFENNFRLIFKLFGRQSNILLLDQNSVIEIFKKGYKSDLDLTEETLNRNIDQSADAVRSSLPDYRYIFPTLDKKMIKQIDNEIAGKDVDQSTKLILKLIDQYKNPKGYFINDQYPPAIEFYLTGSEDSVITSPTEVITQYFFKYLRAKNFHQLRSNLMQDVNRNIGKTEVYLSKTRRKASSIGNETNYKQLADVLMANLHIIPSNISSVVLPNLYEEGTNIEIKLKAQLSALQNAERYYKKGKNVILEIKNLEKSIALKEQQLATLQQQKEAIEQADDIRSLRNFAKADVAKKTIKEVPFKQFEIDGYTVYVGNNAKQNDLLTLKYAKKDDLFFHAKDVSGSHVILKQKPGSNVPVRTLETVASLAAYYSKRKTDTLCPVGYTEKKYVRKPKGSAPGLVLVDREKVLLVPPGLPESS